VRSSLGRIRALLIVLVPLGAGAWGGTGPPAAPEPVPVARPAPEMAATAMRPEAQAYYERGLARFAARDYAGAVADLEAGYALDPRREFLFAEGQAKRLAGDCTGAVALFQRFLASDPPPVQANATQIALGRCAQQMAAHPEVVVVAPPAPPPPPRAPPPPWWHDAWGLRLSIAGAVGVAVGTGFLIAAYGARSDAGNATNYADYDARFATAESRRNIGVTALAVGGALVAGGVVRFVLVRREARAQASLAIGPGTIGVGGTF
jgi:tetratricopeptide (TPR) repeat protein